MTLRLVVLDYPPPGPIRTAPLPPGEVHVWHWEPVCLPDQLDTLWKTLSEDERQRAERYRLAEHRNQFVINRAHMRRLLAAYRAMAPEELVFRYSAYGKPLLHHRETLRFNLSHTKGRTALAVVEQREIGIDVEQIRSQADAARIAERFFSAQERRALRQVPADHLDRAFFRCWTRKEAYIKARGEGLSIPLQDFDVSLEDHAARLLSTRPDPEEANRWMLYDVRLAPGYAAALAVATDPVESTARHA